MDNEFLGERTEQPGARRQLEVILKLSERCNIDCKYCYYFKNSDQRHAERPSILRERMIESLAIFLADALNRRIVDRVRIIFHGGEPLLVGKSRFRDVCERLRKHCGPERITLALQTNGTIVDDEWVKLFSMFDVRVCVSVDGPRAINDFVRVDKKGKGTYSRIRKSIDLLKSAEHTGDILPISALIVVNPIFDPVEIYRHVVHELGIKNIDFLLPNVTHDQKPDRVADFLPYMRRLFHAWLRDDDPDIRVRILNSFISLIVSGKTHLGGFGGQVPLAITVGTNGDVDGDDFLKPCGVEFVRTGHNITNCRLDDILDEGSIRAVNRMIERLPSKCRTCDIAGICRGGQATHRYSKERDFDNPSIYCDMLYGVFSDAISVLLSNGLDSSHLAERLLAVHQDVAA